MSSSVITPSPFTSLYLMSPGMMGKLAKLSCEGLWSMSAWSLNKPKAMKPRVCP